MRGRAVVIEDLYDASEVGRAGIALHEPLDQLAANQWADIGMVEDVIEALLKIREAITVVRRGGGIGLRAGNGRCRGT
jgi:hypothetical protein